MKRNISDLREILFQTMEDLRAGKIDVSKAKEIGSIGQVIVNSAVAETRHLQLNGGAGTGFIQEEVQPLRIAREQTVSEHEKLLLKYS